jgi:S-methylmethionine-dependent homocysteine/selenocysteine methylase
MSHRDHLPQLGGDLFVSDGGIETTLIFHEGLDLPLFAAFDLLKDEEGTEALRRYFETYAKLAADSGSGFILESPTWRASPRWAAELGYSNEELDGLNRKAIALLEEIRQRYESPDTPIVISGCIGPQDDGYNPAGRMTAAEAEDYHSTQIGTFADTAADMVNAMTMTYSDEAIGVARAAGAAGMPVAIHFTVETDGRLPSTEALGDAIAAVVDATDDGPAYFGINCAHPTHFDDVLASAGEWRERIRGLRPNA